MPSVGQSITACRALAVPVSVNRAARTVEVVWSTGARARNFVPPYGPILEELDMRPEAVRMDALRSGRAPVLDTHRRAGTRDVLGRVTAARLEAGRGYETYDAIADACCDAWNALVAEPARITSIATRKWAAVRERGRWYQMLRAPAELHALQPLVPRCHGIALGYRVVPFRPGRQQQRAQRRGIIGQ